MGDKERDDVGDSDYNPGKDLPQLDYDPHKKSYDDGGTSDHRDGSTTDYREGGHTERDDDDHCGGKE